MRACVCLCLLGVYFMEVFVLVHVKIKVVLNTEKASDSKKSKYFVFSVKNSKCGTARSDHAGP